MTLKPLKVAIIGAGPAGCTLARLVQHLARHEEPAIDLTIFERETHLHDRDQGGTLDLHDHTGLAALKLAGLYESSEFQSMVRWDGDAIVLCDKNMKRWLDLGSTAEGGWFAQGKPEVDRLQLRQLLLNSLLPGTVQWGKKVTDIRLSPSTGSTILFEDGSSRSGFDLVVGADGSGSLVRPLVTVQKPFFSGVGGWNMLCRNANLTRPALTKIVNRGSLFAFSDGKVVMGQQLSGGSIYISIWALKPENWMQTSTFDVNDPIAVKAALLEEFKDWAPELREMIASFDETKVWPRNLTMLPTGIRWDTRPGVTLLGDAAHVICPFVGEGVNAAMGDAIGLAQALIKATYTKWTSSSITKAVAVYEKNMIKRAHKSASLTEDIMKLMLFTPGAPESTIEKYLVRATGDDMPFFALPIWRTLVDQYYFFFRLLR